MRYCFLSWRKLGSTAGLIGVLLASSICVVQAQPSNRPPISRPPESMGQPQATPVPAPVTAVAPQQGKPARPADDVDVISDALSVPPKQFDQPHPIAAAHPEHWVVVCVAGCRSGIPSIAGMRPRGPTYAVAAVKSNIVLTSLASVSQPAPPANTDDRRIPPRKMFSGPLGPRLFARTARAPSRYTVPARIITASRFIHRHVVKTDAAKSKRAAGPKASKTRRYAQSVKRRGRA